MRVAVLLLLTAATAAGQTMSILPVNSSGPIPPPGPSCATMRCSPNTTCVDLPTGSVCQANGPSNSTLPIGPSCLTVKCTANTTCVETLTGPQCQNIGSANSTVPINPCANYTCPTGQICKLQEVVCIRAPCPPLPACVPASSGPSCMTIKCAANSTCVDLPTGSVCQPIGNSNSTVNPCASMSCPVGEICKQQEVVCKRAPCPPVAACVPVGPSCMTMKCAANTTCVDLPTGSVCQPNGASNSTLPGPSCLTMKCTANTTCVETLTGPVCQLIGSNSTVNPCANFTCPAGQTCKLQEVACIRAPCPPVPACVPASSGPSCMTMKCAANTTCVDLPTGSVCQPNGEYNPCAATSCPVGSTCHSQMVQCLVAPCQPIGVCRPANGTGSSNSTNPCAAMTCPVGQVCEAKTVNCLVAPCPPIAECVTRTANSSSCLFIKCSAGFECRNGDKGETCYPVVVPPTSNVCTNHTCPLGQKCTVIQVNCLIPPCAPIPSCVRESSSNLTCATVKCTANSTCVQLPRGPVCKPNRGPEHPCNMMECAAGFFCVVQHGEADCVKRSGASCAATSCPVNTTCIEFKEGAQCMSGILTGGCANITCGGGARCKETPNGARCISGGRRDDRVVDIFGCGRGEQYTQCMPRCEDTCRGIQTCDLSIPLRPSNISLGMNDTVATNGTVWANATILSNSTINNNSTMGGNWTTPNLPSTCVPGCMCRDRFKRNVQGNCVPNNRCWLTPGCRDNETWSKCRGCEKTCDAPFSAAPCTAICQSGCACDEGFVRCKMGMCVLPEDCRAMDLISGGHGNLTIAG